MVEAGRRYRLTNDRLLEVLQITPEEYRQLRTIIPHTEKANRRRVRLKRVTRAEYEAQRLIETEKRKKQALEMRQNGLSYRGIASQMDMTAAGVYKLLKGC